MKRSISLQLFTLICSLLLYLECQPFEQADYVKFAQKINPFLWQLSGFNIEYDAASASFEVVGSIGSADTGPLYEVGHKLHTDEFPASIGIKLDFEDLPATIVATDNFDDVKSFFNPSSFDLDTQLFPVVSHNGIETPSNWTQYVVNLGLPINKSVYYDRLVVCFLIKEPFSDCKVLESGAIQKVIKGVVVQKIPNAHEFLLTTTAELKCKRFYTMENLVYDAATDFFLMPDFSTHAVLLLKNSKLLSKFFTHPAIPLFFTASNNFLIEAANYIGMTLEYDEEKKYFIDTQVKNTLYSRCELFELFSSHAELEKVFTFIKPGLAKSTNGRGDSSKSFDGFINSEATEKTSFADLIFSALYGTISYEQVEQHLKEDVVDKVLTDDTKSLVSSYYYIQKVVIIFFLGVVIVAVGFLLYWYLFESCGLKQCCWH